MRQYHRGRGRLCSGADAPDYTVPAEIREKVGKKIMYKAFLIKYAEIAIKGKNRYLFEDALVSQINHALKKVDGEFLVRKEQGRIYVDAKSDYDFEEVVEALKCVFGIVGICPVVLVEDEGFERLTEDVLAHIRQAYPVQNFTFKVNARRARKNYPMESMEINAAIGEKILEAFPETKVDVHKPQVNINIEIRNQINIYSQVIPGPGGMPVGTNGKAMLLLSGGIDSPVAGYMIAKRGVTIDATYFHAPPYTSERAKQKVVDLAKIIAKYSGPINLHVVNFTDIQLYIYEKCPHEELTIIMRRYMMKLAEHFAKENKCLGLITGESIGQVASQTMQSLAATNEVCTIPVYRPLIGFDKQEIVEISEKIDAYETSILPYEDCCTIFVAKHPVTKPSLNVIHNDEKKLNEKIDALMQEAIDTVEVIHIEA
jgi:thiamine biosynthesis protein ThiI